LKPRAECERQRRSRRPRGRSIDVSADRGHEIDAPHPLHQEPRTFVVIDHRLEAHEPAMARRREGFDDRARPIDLGAIDRFCSQILA
jgi:hypothetical protein